MPRPYGASATDTTIAALPDGGADVLPDGSRRWLVRDELARRLRTSAADPGLRGDLERFVGETTDDLPPLA